MTKAQFKNGLNSELKAAGFSERVVKVDELDVNTTLLFDSGISQKLGEWLNKRFSNGITTAPGTVSNLVILNTPKQARDLGIKEVQG